MDVPADRPGHLIVAEAVGLVIGTTIGAVISALIPDKLRAHLEKETHHDGDA